VRARRPWLAPLAAALLAWPALALAADSDAMAQQGLVRQGLDAFDAGVELAARNAPAARAKFQAAAAAFAALRQAGVRNAALEFNLGNTYYRLGDHGRAVAAYRRAQRLDPRDPRIQANLNFARERVTPYIAPTGQGRLLEQLLPWHYTTSAAARYGVLIAAAIVGWGLLALRLRWRTRPLLWGGLAGVALSLAVAASLLAELRLDATQPAAVLIGDPQMLRRGRGEGYEPVFAQPLGPGVEVRVIQERGGWAEVRLADDRTGWLPLSALERV
jgi:tetratricopeptide (TPR) repeat protein